MYANDSDVWISFLGGFLGAGITLLGIYWQINESKKEKKLNEISDTYGAYVLLKKGVDELAGYLTNFKVLFGLHQDLDKELNKLDKITGDNEKEAVKKILSKDVPRVFQKSYNEDLIYNFIQNSLPGEKINLIDKTYSLNILVSGFEKNVSNHFLENNEKAILEFIESHIKMTKKLMNEVNSDKIVFEKKYKEELGI